MLKPLSLAVWSCTTARDIICAIIDLIRINAIKFDSNDAAAHLALGKTPRFGGVTSPAAPSALLPSVA
jgi:hypothetical protein